MTKAADLCLSFFMTSPSDCGYLAQRKARAIVVDPDHPKDAPLYGLLSQIGFRRNGATIYRPHCDDCRACIPVRIPVDEFRPSRSQRRVRAANRDLSLRILAPTFDDGHFALYKKYLRARHPKSEMNEASASDYQAFLFSPWCDSLLFEYSIDDRLIAVAVIDRLPNALSCVYTFFDPEHGHRSPGSKAILQAIEYARGSNRRWVYLGYYIPDSTSMRYKGNWHPQERLIEGRWRRFEKGSTAAMIRSPARTGMGKAGDRAMDM
ncbi:arginyltransferase [Thioalkalivibrio sp. HK1]|uniref:arginyltransferase n=1 Tax=Thioalkalivibrio sp. HK1 TaxID=1469245 RepID=UPI0004728732|nr:arginyltransferase [Thioalkalivibrio sp. HK1]